MNLLEVIDKDCFKNCNKISTNCLKPNVSMKKKRDNFMTKDKNRVI